MTADSILQLPITLLLVMCMATSFSRAESTSDSAATDEDIEAWLQGEDLKELEIPELDEWLPPLSIWDVSGQVFGGLGYRNNVLLSAVDAKESAFVLSGFEASILRMPLEGPRFTTFLNAEHLTFISNDDLPDDTFVSLYSQLAVPLPHDFTGEIAVTSYYMDQVIDLATADVPLEPLRMRGYGIAPDFTLRKNWGRLFAEGTLSLSRQEFKAPLYDYWEYGPELTLGTAFDQTELSVGLEYLQRDYDDRQAFSTTGASIPGTDLSFQILRPQLNVRRTWDEQGRWRTHSRIGFEFLRDNETDYFAYDRLRLSQRISYHRDKWDVEAGLRYSFYDYAVQEVSQADEFRQRHSWRANIEINRYFREKFRVFAGYDYEKNHSNEQETDYSVHTWSLGAGWTF